MNTELLDTDKIESLSNLLGDDFNMIIDVFVSTTPDALQSIRQAQQANDSDELRKLLHSLKGSSGNVGARAFSAKCLDLETILKAGNGGINDDQIVQLEQLFDATREAYSSS